MINYVTQETLEERTNDWLQGIEPFNLHKWRPGKTNSALLVIDCQNYFVEEPGPDGAPILPNIKKLIETFKDNDRPVIFTRHMHTSDMSDAGMLGEWWGDLIMENTHESKLHPGLGVSPDDIVVRKNRYNAFQGTELDDILKEKGVTDVVITGVLTNLCCETTAREAFCRDFKVYFVADGTGTVCEEMHFASLMNISYGIGTVLKTSDVEGVFK